MFPFFKMPPNPTLPLTIHDARANAGGGFVSPTKFINLRQTQTEWLHSTLIELEQ